MTGKTLFTLPTEAVARTVVLEAFNDRHCIRVEMHREEQGWTARLNLPPGWFFYRFEVDGKARRDRVGGKLRTEDGRPCSFALIQ